jgi:hypothetical protein
MEINSLSNSGPVNGSTKAKPAFKGKVTAAKVTQVQVQILKDRASSLIERWNTLVPEEIAEEIIDIKDRASPLNNPQLTKQVEDLHFQFVFPIIPDLNSFATEIQKAAQRVLKTQTPAAFQELSQTQQQEILRNAVGGKS